MGCDVQDDDSSYNIWLSLFRSNRLGNTHAIADGDAAAVVSSEPFTGLWGSSCDAVEIIDKRILHEGGLSSPLRLSDARDNSEYTVS